MNKNKRQAVAYAILAMSPFILMIVLVVGLAIHQGVLRETLAVSICLVGSFVLFFGTPLVLNGIFSTSIRSLDKSIELWKKDQSNE